MPFPVSVLAGLALMAPSSAAPAPAVSAEPPYAFVYGGTRAAAAQWPATLQSVPLDRQRVQETHIRRDPATGLEVRAVAVRYKDFPAVREWTVYLRNTGNSDTPLIEDLEALDETWQSASGSDFILHHNVGSPANGSDYGPLETPLAPGSRTRLGASGGRPTQTDWSYFNIAWGGQGRIVAVGWPGQWAATFERDAASGLRLVAGQEKTRFRLHPGEEVRTPLIVTLDWTGDWIDGQNQWRRWMIAHGVPRPGGKLPQPIMLASSGRQYGEMVGADEQNQKMFVQRYVDEGFRLDYWWMDAGWYVQQKGWPQVGTWEVDPKRFPNGLRAVSDYARKRGVKTLVWFEPERVAPGTWLADHHPEWLLSAFQTLQTLRSSAVAHSEPNVTVNSGSEPVERIGIRWDAHSLSLHPGPNGEYSVLRFVAPASGGYRLRAAFAAIDPKATTDVHIVQGGRPRLDGFIGLNGFGERLASEQVVELAKGETLDFVVGRGNGDYRWDSTGLAASLTGPDGVEFDAAKALAQPDGNAARVWSAGWLPAAPKPDTSAFLPYDRREAGVEGGNRLLNLGDPAARTWITEHVDGLIRSQGIDLYRQDFNMNPLDCWRSADAPDRQGITENHYVVGYLAYWDELRRRHPNMLIDSCASGGRRNDLESMRRAVPLWRSDYAYEPVGHQCMTYGMSLWLPYFGTGTVADEKAPYYGSGVTPVRPYAFWSDATPSLGSGIDIREKSLDYAALRRLWSAWRDVMPFYYGDFYPLTPWTRQKDNWIAWQFDRPDKGDGLVQAFRRTEAAQDTIVVRLRGLKPDARYAVTVTDGAAPATAGTFSGAVLRDAGLKVVLPRTDAAAVLRYRQVK